MQRALRTLALLAVALTGCAHVIHDVREPSIAPPVASCGASEPAQPPEVVRGEKGGLLFVQFTVEADGAITDVKPGPLDSEPDPILFAAARDYVSQCKWKPGTQAGKPVATHLSRGFAFAAPYLVDHAAPAPVEWTDALAKTLGAPQILHCLPDDPRLWDGLNDARLSVVVQRDGHAGDVQFVGAAAPGEDASGYALAAQWLRSCRFQPALDASKASAPVAVRVGLPFLFHDELTQAPSDTSLPLADGANIPIPQPTSNCDPHPWPSAGRDLETDFDAGPGSDDKRKLGHGPPQLEVEYTVDTNGTASNVLLRESTRRDVFHAVRRYLLGCEFMPVHDETGQPIAVRVRRKFNLRVGTRKLSPNGGEERIVEGDPP